MTDYLDTQQAAKLLKQSVFTLKKWRWQKRGPAYSKIGRRILYSPEAISEFFLKCSQTKKEARA